jgi:DNA-binding CsgD family transcriptional regulator
MLVGRDAELERISKLVDEAAEGRGGALVLRGEAGIGKSSLLDQARTTATLISTSGTEAESAIPFAGLGDVLRPLLGSLDSLADAHAAAIRIVLGLSEPRPVDRLTLGTATLSLLAAAAPLTMLVDDAHWLDSESQDALVFAARRLAADPIAIIFAAREGDLRRFDAEGLDELIIRGLQHDHARALLDERVSSPRVADALVASTEGNPLALLELPGILSAAQLAGDEPLEQPLRVGDAIERGFSRRVQLLGEDARLAAVTVAADDSGDAAAITAAVESLGLGIDDLVRAEDAGVLRRVGTQLRFSHPLVGSAVYHGAAPSERRRVHAALAAVLAGRDDERQAWHLAAAAVGDDPETADLLERVAQGAFQRGAYDSSARAFERAARLTVAGPARASRLAAAADAALLAGRTQHATRLADEGMRSGAEGAARAALLAIKARLASLDRDQRTAFDAFMEAATLTEGTDPQTTALLLAEAVAVGIQLDRDAVQAAGTRLRALRLPRDPRTEFFVTQALGAAASQVGTPDSAELISRAVTIVDAGEFPLTSAQDLFWAGRAHFMFGRHSAAASYARRAVDAAREEGALGVLPMSQRLLASASFEIGDWRLAYAAAGDAVAVAAEVDQRTTACACYGVLADLDAASGNEGACRDHARAAIELADEIGLAYYRERAERALGHLELALGRLDPAARLLEGVLARLHAVGNFEFNITPVWDLAETYVRLGRVEDARRLLDAAEDDAPPVSTLERAVVERCRGLVADDFEPWFERALASHAPTELGETIPFERARTELCFGERLRRRGDRREARAHLRSALATFDKLGARAWMARGDAELRASGERLQPREASREQLTPREMQIALSVAGGQSNREVAAALYVTPKTVEFHLTHIYRKLGIRSRSQLARRFRS